MLLDVDVEVPKRSSMPEDDVCGTVCLCPPARDDREAAATPVVDVDEDDDDEPKLEKGSADEEEAKAAAVGGADRRGGARVGGALPVFCEEDGWRRAPIPEPTLKLGTPEDED